MRAGVYVRMSQDREGAGLGVERQEADCRALATELGWDISEVYVDNDLTADTKSRRHRTRPAYGRLKADIAAGDVDAVLAWHTDRLHRTPRELEDFIDLCEPTNTPVRTVKAGLVDLGTPSGRAIARTLCAWANYESEHKKERQRAQARQAAEAGRNGNGGYRPFGYDRLRTMVIEDEAAVLRECYSKVLNGRSLRSIVHWLNDQGVTTTTGRPWTQQGLRYNLLSGRNTALREYHREVVGPALWPPIVDRATWERARSLLTRPGRYAPRLDGARNDAARKYLLTGYLHCGRCGHKLRPIRSSATQRFGCPATKEGGCGGILVRYEPAHDHIVSLLLARLERDGDLHSRPPHDPTAELLEQIATAETRLQQLAEAFADDTDANPLELRAAGARIRKQISTARGQIAQAAGAARVAQPLVVRDAWLRGDYDLAQQRSVLDQLVERIDVMPAAVRGRARFEPARLSIVWR